MQSDVVTMIDNGKKYTQVANDKQKNQKIITSNSILTAADMYESGFRIENTNICSSHTRLLVLITSAAAPSHSLNRQAIRMTWMNRYGPSVSMAFLVGTPQMNETDPMGQMLEAEEQALQMRLNRIDVNNNIDPKLKPPAFVSPLVTGDFGWYRFLRDQEEPNPREGLDARAMEGLNKAEQAVQRVLGREHDRYGDLIQCRVRDTYTNLTLKSIAALEWTNQYCPLARYLLKTDDDMFIDVHRLLKFIDKVETEAIRENHFHTRSHVPMQSNELPNVNRNVFESISASDFNIELPATIWGRLAHGWRPIRQHNSKYYVSRTQYAGQVYPDFCTGPAYLMTQSAVRPIYEAALGRDFEVMDDDDSGGNDYEETGNNNKKGSTVYSNRTTRKNTVPYLKLEDVYLTGVVAERLTRRAADRVARRLNKKKISLTVPRNRNHSAENRGKSSAKLRSNIANSMIIKIRRIHDDQFANKKITGRALDRAVCSGSVSSNDAVAAAIPGANSGFSWFRWYWGDTGAVAAAAAAAAKSPKKKKVDQGVISVHMVKYFEQFDLWRRLMDGRTKCKL